MICELCEEEVTKLYNQEHIMLEADICGDCLINSATFEIDELQKVINKVDEDQKENQS